MGVVLMILSFASHLGQESGQLAERMRLTKLTVGLIVLVVLMFYYGGVHSVRRRYAFSPPGSCSRRSPRSPGTGVHFRYSGGSCPLPLGHRSAVLEVFLAFFLNMRSSREPQICARTTGKATTGRPSAGPSPIDPPFSLGHSLCRRVVGKLISGTERDNALRFGIAVRLGLSTASAFAEYELGDIMVIPNGDELVAFEGLRGAERKRSLRRNDATKRRTGTRSLPFCRIHR